MRRYVPFVCLAITLSVVISLASTENTSAHPADATALLSAQQAHRLLVRLNPPPKPDPPPPGPVVPTYSVPAYIVACESGGNWSAVNPSSGAGGAYQILPSTWAAYGGTGAPQDASPAEQSRIAAAIYADSGGSAWVCG